MSSPAPPRKISSLEFCRALEAAGLIHDLDTVTKVTITAKPRHTVTIDVERFADERLYLGLTAMLDARETPGGQ